MPRRKKSPLKLKIRTETLLTITGFMFIGLGLLVMVSLTGQGVLLAAINEILTASLGFSQLFLPFIFISAGLVLFQTKWAWSKPHVLLGSILLMVGVLGLFRTGEIGTETFINVSELLTPYGAGVLFGVVLISGALIMSQLSFNEIMDLLERPAKPKPEAEPIQELNLHPSAEEIKEAKGFKIPKLSLPFGKKQAFDVNENEFDQTEDKAQANTAVTPPTAGPQAATQSLAKPGDLEICLATPNNQPR
jgi:hypothetical protein